MSGGSNQGSRLLSRAERERRSLDDTWITVLGHICLRLVQQVWVSSSSKDTLFEQLLDGVVFTWLNNSNCPFCDFIGSIELPLDFYTKWS